MTRLEEAEQKYGQLFGWIATPDQHFLVEFLPIIAKEFSNPPRIVEVGTFYGSTARGLMALTGGTCTSMDNWKDFHPSDKYKTGEEAFWDTVKSNGVDLTDRARLIPGDSKEIGSRWQEPIDILFIDGDHSFAGALGDIQLFTPHIVSGGYCFVDDWDMPEVRRAVTDGFSLQEWETIRVPLDTTSKILVVRKKRMGEEGR